MTPQLDLLVLFTYRFQEQFISPIISQYSCKVKGSSKNSKWMSLSKISFSDLLQFSLNPWWIQGKLQKKMRVKDWRNRQSGVFRGPLYAKRKKPRNSFRKNCKFFVKFH